MLTVSQPKRRWMAMGLVAACVLPVAAGCGSAASARYGAYEQAVNRGDVAAAMQIVADDFVFRTKTGESVGSRADLQRDLERGVVFGRRLTSSDRRMRDGMLHLLATDENEYYRLLGMPPRTYELAVAVDNDRISAMTVGRTISEGPTEREALPPFLAWARGQHRDELNRVYPIDNCASGTESGQVWLDMLRLWRQQAPLTSLTVPEKPDMRKRMAPMRYPRGTAPGSDAPDAKPAQPQVPRRPQ